ncbi:MAG TPA: oligosaccharide flippase family protein [Candidatus Saccharimonadales bacterium]|nr:oligosaccharide flippase family protein [Candidatus Saccharimonadales bacterium]
MNIHHVVRQSKFLRHNFIFFVGSVAVGVLNYLYYPIMGRMLSPAAFGEVQTLISLFLQVAIFLMVLGLVTINVVANYNSPEKRDAVVLEFEHLALVASIALLGLTIIFHNQLKHFLQFGESWPFVLLMLALVASVPFTFRGAFLRGKQKFGLASMVNVIGAGSKIFFSMALVAVGAGTSGAIGGLVAAQAVACIFAAVWARQHGLIRPEGQKLFRLPNMSLLKPELRYGLLVLAGSLLVTLQYSIDVVVVKHYFNPHTAGLYAGMASVARIIFFLTASVALVLMPMVKIHAPARTNHGLLLKSLALLGIAGVPVLVLFIIAPERIVALLMGNGYASVSYLLPQLSVTIFTVSALNLIVSYYLALRRYAVAPIIIIGAAATYALLLTRHSTLSAIVNDLLIGSIAMLSLILVCTRILNPRS